MDALTQFVDDNLLSKKNILRYLDDYSIYSFYIGAELELRTKYSSPLRDGDQDPSFSIFYSKYNEDQIYFKDSALNKFGNVFDFLELFLKSPSREVLLQINSDFGLGFDGDDVGAFKPHLIKKKPLKKKPTTILINAKKEESEEYLKYWELLDISKKTRDKFFASDVKVIHYDSDYRSTIIPRELSIAYEILGTYKIYHPYAERKYKFRNNFKDIYVEGAMQLEFKQEFAIITKATKECMFFYQHFRWEAVAGKSETTPINPYFMENVLKVKYKQVFIWLDKDKAGATSQAAYIEKYPWLEPIEFPAIVEEKDPTDYYDRMKKQGLQKTALNNIKQLILGRIKNH